MLDVGSKLTQDISLKLSRLCTVDIDIRVRPIDIAFYGIESVDSLFIDEFIVILRTHNLFKDLIQISVEEDENRIVINYRFSKDVFFNDELDLDIINFESLIRDYSGCIEYSYISKQFSVVLYEKSVSDKIIS